jgi:hypothetical protein
MNREMTVEVVRIADGFNTRARFARRSDVPTARSHASIKRPHRKQDFL